MNILFRLDDGTITIEWWGLSSQSLCVIFTSGPRVAYCHEIKKNDEKK
jgi:hypothetical protein